MLAIKDWDICKSSGLLQVDIVKGASIAGRLDRRRPIARRLRFEELFRRRWSTLQQKRRWWRKHQRDVLGPSPGARRVQAMVDAVAEAIRENAALGRLAWHYAERMEAWQERPACI